MVRNAGSSRHRAVALSVEFHWRARVQRLCLRRLLHWISRSSKIAVTGHCREYVVRVWLNTFPRVGETASVAREAEQAGFFGVLLTDSQCLFPDAFIELSVVAGATEQLHIGTCASNVVTRHQTVVASQAATLQSESCGRMHLGLARGDSSVTKIGLRPLTPTEFGQALTNVRDLTAGRPVESAGTPAAVEWLDPQAEPVPVLGVASGPRSIRAAALHADGLILQLGSDPEAVRTWIAKVRELQPDPNFRIASYAIVGLAEQSDESSSIRGVTPLLARMAGEGLSAVGSEQAHLATAAAETYSLSSHGLTEAAPSSNRPSDSYAISGSTAQCRDQLMAIAGLGCDELVVILGSIDTPMPQLIRDIRLFGSEILPEINKVQPRNAARGESATGPSL